MYLPGVEVGAVRRAVPTHGVAPGAVALRRLHVALVATPATAAAAAAAAAAAVRRGGVAIRGVGD